MCPDEWMAHLGIDIFDSSMRERLESLQWDLSRQLLRNGSTVVIEWGTWARAERDALRTGARELRAAVELHYLDATPDVLWQRIQDRGMEQELGSRAVQRSELDLWLRSFQPPTDEELALFDPPAAHFGTGPKPSTNA
jgi:predicted kinase